MRLRKMIALCAVTAGLFPSPAPASIMQPSGPWNLDYGETQCIAARNYGEGAKPTIFALVPSIIGESYDLLVSGAWPGPQYADESSGSVSFGRSSFPSWSLHYTGPEPGSSIYRYTISADQMAEARSAGTLALRRSDGRRFDFSLGNMAELLDGLQKCTADLQRYWNFHDPSLRSSARGDVRTIFKPDDYPDEAMSRQQQGSVQYVLLINEKGSVAGCHVIRPSGVPALDAMGCEVIVKRAKFVPATDNSGKPVRDTVTTPPVSWRIK